VSFGRHEAARDRFSPERFSAAGVDVVRRPTGGRALVHHHELTYAIAGAAEPAHSVRARYAVTQQLVVRALRVLGVRAGVSAGTRPDALALACFGAPVPGEIVVGSRKLAASAQWRHERAWLQHGSILLHDDQSMLSLGTIPGISLPPLPPAATLVSELGREPTREQLAAALVSAVESEGQAARLVDASAFELDHTRYIDRYASTAWTWRR
jgi:lipoate-protein ligase A